MELRTIRTEKGLTQAQAAAIAGVSVESYKNHESGRSKIDSPLGQMILQRISNYEEYDFDRGILPLQRIKEKTAEIFSRKDIDFAFLFGSYAKGEATESSDVDILISGTITGLEFFSLGGELERALRKRVDVLRLGDIVSNTELIEEILSTGVKIYVKAKR